MSGHYDFFVGRDEWVDNALSKLAFRLNQAEHHRYYGEVTITPIGSPAITTEEVGAGPRIFYKVAQLVYIKPLEKQT